MVVSNVGREGVVGAISGAISGAIVSGLMKVKQPTITSNKQIISQQRLMAGATGVSLLPATTYKFAIVLFHGDGDQQVNLTITINGAQTTLYANEQAIELLANQEISITADNTDTTSERNTPTIEVLSLAW